MARSRTRLISLSVVMLLTGVMVGVVLAGTVSAAVRPPANPGQLQARVETLETLLAGVTRADHDREASWEFPRNIVVENLLAHRDLVAEGDVDSVNNVFANVEGTTNGDFINCGDTPVPGCSNFP